MDGVALCQIDEDASPFLEVEVRNLRPRRILGVVAVVALCVAAVGLACKPAGAAASTVKKAKFLGLVEHTPATATIDNEKGVWYRLIEEAAVRDNVALDSKEADWSPINYGERALVVDTNGRRAKIEVERGGKTHHGWASVYTKSGVTIMEPISEQDDPGKADKVFKDIRDARKELNDNMHILFKKMGIHNVNDLSRDNINDAMHDKVDEVEGYIGSAKDKVHKAGITQRDVKTAEGGVRKIVNALAPGKNYDEKISNLKDKGRSAIEGVKNKMSAATDKDAKN